MIDLCKTDPLTGDRAVWVPVSAACNQLCDPTKFPYPLLASSSFYGHCRALWSLESLWSVSADSLRCGFGRLAFPRALLALCALKARRSWILALLCKTTLLWREEGVGYMFGPIKNLLFLLTSPFPCAVSPPPTTLRGSELVTLWTSVLFK